MVIQNIDLNNLTAGQGFQIQGVFANNTRNFVSGAGDVNGDGYADIIIGAIGASLLGRVGAGASYVLFGKSAGLGTIDLSALTNSQGFQIQGGVSGDYSGNSVSGAGDINGDGIADIIIGSPLASPLGRTGAGASYVIFGKTSGLGTVDLSALTTSQGFQIQGAASGDYSGYSVSGAGDVNGDGIADIIIGAAGASPLGRTGAGASYVIFGKSSGLGTIDLGAFTTSQGFQIQGANGDQSSGDKYGGIGHSVGGAGDINGDGFADVIVGAYWARPLGRVFAGASYVIFGKSSGIGTIDLGALTTSQGFQIQGAYAYDQSGNSVSGAGDVNGDGIGDIIVGAYYAAPLGRIWAGASYVVYGRTSGFSAIDLNALSADQGFQIQGAHAHDQSGWSVSGAGDINGDGFADVIIGTLQASNGVGTSYVVYGNGTSSKPHSSTGSASPSMGSTSTGFNPTNSAFSSTAQSITSNGYSTSFISSSLSNTAIQMYSSTGNGGDNHFVSDATSLGGEYLLETALIAGVTTILLIGEYLT